MFAKYSEALGIAYQIRDDLDDLTGTDAPDDIAALRPSLPLAVGVERAKGQDEEAHARCWRHGGATQRHAGRVARPADRAERRGSLPPLLESYKEEAIRSLAVLDEPTLKGLLRRIVGKIFNDIELKGWCREFEARNAAGRAAGADAAAVVG